MDLPRHLSGTVPRGVIENEPIAQFELGSLRNFVYLILDWAGKRAAWVDPQSDLSAPLAELERHGFTLERVLLTHTHHDHIAGVPGLLKKFPGLPVNVQAKDAFRLGPSHGAGSSLRPLADGEEVRVGDLRVRCLHTPGHSAGECSYFLEGKPPYLLTGDTVFIRNCGRTDFETGSDLEMFESLQRLKKLPPDTVILPGHHYTPELASTIGREMRESPPFLCLTVEELAALP